LKLLVSEELALFKENYKIAGEIENNDDFDKIIAKYDLKPEPEYKSIDKTDWWLERFFTQRHIPFVIGVFLIYLSVGAIPNSIFVLLLSNSVPSSFYTGLLASYVGSLIIFIILLPLNYIKKNLNKLIDFTNQNLCKRLATSSTLIEGKHLLTNDTLEQLDQKFMSYYSHPYLIKSLRLSAKLAFDTKYQITAGLIGASTVIIIIVLRYALNILPKYVFNFWIPIENPFISTSYMYYGIFGTTFLWFLVGMSAWSLFIVFFITLHLAAQTFSFRPFERLKELFQPTTRLVLSVSFALSMIVTWSIPYFLLWGIFSITSTERQALMNFVEGSLIITIPMIILSFLIPYLKIHQGIKDSMKRALLIKTFRIEQLKKNPLKNVDKHLNIQNHLMDDYKLIVENSEWTINGSQLLEIIGTILLPLLSLLLSQLF
jgi:hypothetical protein